MRIPLLYRYAYERDPHVKKHSTPKYFALFSALTKYRAGHLSL